MNLEFNSTRGFCMSALHYGSPLSFTGKYEHGFPLVTLYNGSDFCGISNETVVSIDSWGVPHVREGGMINIIRPGYSARILNNLIINPKDAQFNQFVKPHKSGKWRIQKKRTKDTVGTIEVISEHYIEIRLI